MKFKFSSSEPPPWVSSQNWLDWKWQLKNSLETAKDFTQYFQLTEVEQQAFSKQQNIFKVRVSPYYASLCSQHLQDPIRKILMPQILEFKTEGQQMLDPLGEIKHSPVPRLIHRYPDRVLFLVTDFCSVYCRYCTRKHFTGKDQVLIKKQEYEQALDYIKNNKAICEVILSGGDPLTLSDSVLDRVLDDLRSIEHIEIIRIGSRMPVVAPMRMTESLVQILKKHTPIFVMTHFNHPKELSDLAAQALGLLVDNGIPLFNQMVLLNGVNNHAAIVQALSRRLLYLRVKPYYMFQCDPSQGTDHLRISIDESMQIQRELWGRLSGLAMPNLSLDIPHGGGKVGLVPDFSLEKTLEGTKYCGWDGIAATYKNPDLNLTEQPFDVEDYQEEWKCIKNADYGGCCSLLS